jgi:hypothetical protein
MSNLSLAVALALAGVSWTASADPIRGAGVETIEHSYGRAGGLIASDVVTEPEAWDRDGPPVTIAYSLEAAHWTNMPREQAAEGPVSAGEPPSTVPWYGRAGGAVGPDEIESMKGQP